MKNAHSRVGLCALLVLGSTVALGSLGSLGCPGTYRPSASSSTAVNKLDHVRVEYAGGASTSGSGSCPVNAELNNDAAIRISGWPMAQFLTNSEIVSSATNGIDRGWRDDRAKIDFLSTVTFTNVALCNQTYPPDSNNVCPADGEVPCPKN